MLEIKIEDKLDSNYAGAQFKEIVNKVEPEIRRKALIKAGLALWGDVVGMPPKPPVDTGFLKDSGSLFVGSEYISITPTGVSGEKGNKSHNEPNKRILTFGLAAKYAAYQHQKMNIDPAKRKHKRPSANVGVGPFFVSKKVTEHRGRYKEIMREEIKKGFKS
jgi:hypothetical protein